MWWLTTVPVPLRREKKTGLYPRTPGDPLESMQARFLLAHSGHFSPSQPDSALESLSPPRPVQQKHGDISIDAKGVITEKTIKPDGKVETTVIGDWEKSMVPTGKVTPLSKEHVGKSFRYGELDAIVSLVFNDAGEVVRTSILKATPRRATRRSLGLNRRQGG